MHFGATDAPEINNLQNQSSFTRWKSQVRILQRPPERIKYQQLVMMINPPKWRVAQVRGVSKTGAPGPAFETWKRIPILREKPSDPHQFPLNPPCNPGLSRSGHHIHFAAHTELRQVDSRLDGKAGMRQQT